MGTRAAFWLGDPRDQETAIWLGCIAWDAYPDGLPELATVKSENDFLTIVRAYRERRDDFADPSKGGWPFPWHDDIFLTDWTYAWFDGRLQMTSFHKGFCDFSVEQPDEYFDAPDSLGEVAIPNGKWDQAQPDSILIIGVR